MKPLYKLQELLDAIEAAGFTVNHIRNMDIISDTYYTVDLVVSLKQHMENGPIVPLGTPKFEIIPYKKETANAQ